MDSFKSKSVLKVGKQAFTIFRLEALKKINPELVRLPFSIRILLENLLRHEDGKAVTRGDIEALCKWGQTPEGSDPNKEIAFTPARVILQDFTGVPAVVDLAAMRDVITQMGGDPKKINPLEPVDLVIDHSVQVDAFASPDAFQKNVEIEYERNRERYQFLNWGQKAFRNFRVVPPGTGIVHQVNLEYLAKVVITKPSPFPSPLGRGEGEGEILAYPDTLVGTDSHTTMINGLGVLGWGVGGIEAEAAMLGQPISMLIPEVVGFQLKGKLRQVATATDLVLTVTEMLRKKGVVGKFVEFFGSGLDALSLADRATVANMAPEYGATIGFFPVDQETLNYLRLSGREEELIARVEAYCKEQGLFRTKDTPEPLFSGTLELDLGNVVPCLAGPKRPQDRVPLGEVKSSFENAFQEILTKSGRSPSPSPLPLSARGRIPCSAVAKPRLRRGERPTLFGGKGGEDKGEGVTHGSVVIAAITSCTNTSNPSVMLGAGILAKKAVERGLRTKPWVKTSLAPGSKVVTDYLIQSGLMPYLEKLGFHLVGYGCTTCIGNSGPLPEPIAKAVLEKELVAAAVLSGNRNFEGRVNPLVRANYLGSPPLVVAYAVAGKMDLDLEKEPIGKDAEAQPVYLRDIWPTPEEIREAMKKVEARMFRKQYSSVFEGDRHWKKIGVPGGDTYRWDSGSTYIKNPPFFHEMPEEPVPLKDIEKARVLVVVKDSVTTDHISPAGSIPKDSPAGKYLIEHGVQPKDFNSYGARRGNYEVMVRGTFANIRLKNLLAPGTEGGLTRYFPPLTHPSPPRGEGKGEGEGIVMSIYDAAMEYQKKGIPLMVLAGKEYGAGSSRDWAAKGPALLGIRAVIAESFERIHRSNLIGMGILPLEFEKGENRESLGLTGEEVFDITGIAKDLAPGKKLTVRVHPSPSPLPSPPEDGSADSRAEGERERVRGTFQVICRIDTPVELAYYQHGGILQYVLRQLMK